MVLGIVVVSGGVSIYLNVSGIVKEDEGEFVTFTTEDGVIIAGTYYPGKTSGAVVLIHMLGRDMRDWNQFASKLIIGGYTVLSIDLRGHGRSVEQDGKTISWQTFVEEDYGNMVLDIRAAEDFLSGKGISRDRIALIGASIGANIALNYAANHENIGTVVLLSPGLNYKEIKTEQAVEEFGERAILLVAGSNDPGAAESAETLHDIALGNKQIVIYNQAGHGTEILSQPEFAHLIIEWLRMHLS